VVATTSSQSTRTWAHWYKVVPKDFDGQCTVASTDVFMASTLTLPLPLAVVVVVVVVVVVLMASMLWLQPVAAQCSTAAARRCRRC
jgi:hypothetical protein